MNYLFVLGKNPEISKLEIVSVLKSSSINFELSDDTGDTLLLEVTDKFDENKIFNKLAGTLKIAKEFFQSENFEKRYLDRIDFYFPKNFEILLADSTSEIYDATKEYLKSSKLKGKILQTELNSFGGRSAFERDKEKAVEVFISKYASKYSYFQFIWYSNNSEYVFKDESRPVQKFTHGSSFRLARMMVNILALPIGKTLVDPFCGIGTFLTEGMINGNNVIGVDISSEMTGASRQNIEWAIKQYNLKQEYKIILGDSGDATFMADGCVFEPYMGPFQKERPNKKQSMAIVKELHNIYKKVFINLQRNLTEKSRVVCIIPEIESKEGQVFKIPSDLFEQTGFKIINLSEEFKGINFQNGIQYLTPDGNKIRRNLWVLERA